MVLIQQADRKLVQAKSQPAVLGKELSLSGEGSSSPLTLDGGASLSPSDLSRPSATGPEHMAHLVRLHFRLKDWRQQFCNGKSLDETAWCLVMDMYLRHLEGAQLFVSSLCSNNYASATTSLRRLDDLVDAGIVTRQSDPFDQRRIPVALTASGLEFAQSYLNYMHTECSIALLLAVSAEQDAGAAT